MVPQSRSWFGRKRARPILGRKQPPRIEELESRLLLDTTPSGYTPAQIRHAYALDQLSTLETGGAPDSVKYNSTAGLGQTIAIVDAYDDTSLASDLHQFDLSFGIPDPPSFSQLNQSGGTAQPASALNTGWALETSLDVEWSHALAPAANIVVVQAGTDLLTAVQTAASLPGVSVVSISFGVADSLEQLITDRIFTTPTGHQGVTFFASSGDSGAPSIYPSDSPNVVAVGGTTLNLDDAGNILSETAWSGSGGGTSGVEAGSSSQNNALGQGTAGRSTPDIAFDADPFTGVPVYDSLDNGTDSPWEQVGGTSFSSPAWAAMTVLADQGRATTGKNTLDGATQLLPFLYQLPAADFNDISAGTSFGFPTICAIPGYDQTTGIGTPIANKLVPALVAYAPPTSSTTIYWTGAAGDNNWDDSANWSFENPGLAITPSAGVLPGPNDDVVINIAHAVVNHSSANYDTVHSLTITAKNVALNVSNGSIDLSAGAGAMGSFSAGQTSTVITLSGGVLRNADLLVGSTVIVPAGSTAVLDGGVFAGAIQVKAGGTLALQGAWTNNGSINVAAGATIYLGDSPDFNDAWSSSPTDPGAASHTWVNNGTIKLTNDTVILGGLLTNTPSSLGKLSLTTADTIFLDGTLVNTGGTLTLTSNWTIDGGRIVGGTLIIPAVNRVVVDANGGYLQNLSSITLNGTLDLEGSPLENSLEEGLSTVGGDAVLTIDATTAAVAVTGGGTILFGESDGSLDTSDPRTGFGNQIIVLGNSLSLAAGIQVVAGGTDVNGNADVGILSGNVISAGTIDIFDVGELELEGTLVNQGTIEDTGDGFINIEANLTNQGTIKENSGGFISINLDLYDPTNPDTTLVSWTNQKTISVTSGTVQLGGLWTNTAAGSITAAAGTTLQLGDDFAFDPTVTGANLDTWINKGRITATNARVGLGGFLTNATTNFGGLHLTTDDLELAGTLVNTNSTFVLKTAGSDNGSWVSVLDGLVYQGTVDIPAGNAVVFSFAPTFENLKGFTLAGTMELESPDGFDTAFMTFENSSPLTISGGGSVTFGASPEVDTFFDEVFANAIFVSGSTLSIGAGVTVALPGVESDGSADQGEIDGPLVNQGTIGGSNGGMLFLNDLLDNQGTIATNGGGTIAVDFNLFDPIDDPSSPPMSWTNEGKLQVAGTSTLQLGGSWTNKAAGIISATAGSSLFLGDEISIDPSTAAEEEADAWVNNGTITTAGANVFLGGWVTHTGANLGSLNLATDDLFLTGTLLNTSQTLEFSSPGAFHGNWVGINGGTVFQGNVVITTGSTVLFGFTGATMEDLDSFTLDGILVVNTTDGITASVLTFDNASGPLTLAGSGFLQFGSSANSEFVIENGIDVIGNTLTISSGVTLVTGDGAVAFISGPIVNEGTIEANIDSNLTIDDLLDNQGSILATNDSEVTINFNQFDPSVPTTLTTWTNEGTITAVSESALGLGGAWTNTSTGVISDLADSEIQLGDTLNFDPTALPAGELDAWVNNGTITVAGGNELFLGGWLTYSSTNFGGLDFSLNDVFLQGTLDNAGSTLALSSASTLDGNFTLDSGSIFQGTVTTADNSTLIAFDGALNGVTLNGTMSVQDFATVSVINGLTLNGTIDLGDTNGASAVLDFDDSSAAQTLSGTGSIVFGTVSDSTSIFSPNEIEIDGSSPLTVAPGVTVTGPGLDANGLADGGLVMGPMLMLGKFAEDAGGTLTVLGPLVNLAAGTLTGGVWEVSNGILQLPSDVTNNAADISITGAGAHLDNGAGTNALQILGANLSAGTLTLGAGTSLALTESFANAGTVTIASGASLSDIGGYSQSSGQTTVDGALQAAQVTLSGGGLRGTGTVNADVTNSGVVSPGDEFPGTLTIQGNYTQTAAGVLTVPLTNDAMGLLNVTGTVTLDGTLALLVTSDFAPAVNTPITLLSFSQRTAGSDFATEIGLGVTQQEFPTLAYTSESLTLTENPYTLAATAVTPSPSSPPPSLGGAIATFTDTFSNDTGASFSVTIDWGDNTPLDTTTGNVTFANGVFTVHGTHTYASPLFASSVVPITVTITSLTAPGVVATVVNEAALGGITGAIFDDANADGALESGELGLSGRTLFLDLNHNGTLDPGEPSALTDAKGDYAFKNVIPGNYTLEFASLPSDAATSASGVYIPVQITGGITLSGQNIGVLNAFSPLPVSTNPTPFGTNNPDASTAVVNGLYVQILGRESDAPGLEFWSHALASGAFTTSQIASQFLHSPEYENNEVQSLYRSILGRVPATTEASFWVGQMQAGLDATSLALAFLSSGEFNAEHATNVSFVQAAFADVLGRGVDAGGLAFWTQQLNSGVSRSAVASAFLNSEELFERAVDNFYEDYLNRAGDSFGLSAWVNDLKVGQVTLTEVALAFLGSSEFEGLAALTVAKP
jgi:Domain of unknown function (DUF4214)/SdrD B-like domain